MTSYEELLGQVAALESSASQRAQGTINIEKALESAPAPSPESYGQLISLIEKSELDTRQRPKAEPEKAHPAPAQQAAAPVRPAQPPAYEAAEEALKEKARSELAAITGTLSQIAPRIEELEMSVSMKGLVLPNLPIAEQISELEKIVEGVRSNIFDKGQMATLRKELRGLKAGMAHEKAVLQKGGAEPAESEKALWAVREQRLNEALAVVK